MIDDQVHFREPGLTHKGDIWTESRAAVTGGITSFMEMPNVNPPTLSIDALERKFALAATKSVANYSFYMGASNDNIEAIKRLDPTSVCGVKAVLGASTGDLLVDDPNALEAIFRESPVIVVTHCEDTPTIMANEEIYRQRYGDRVPIECHPEIRSEEACYRSSSMAVALAKKFGTQLQVLNITTAKELALFEAGPIDNKQITAEVCAHHLFFSKEDYAQKGTLIKCNPAIKNASDRAALLNAVNNDVIDIIATDHAPHTWEEKQNLYFSAPAGLPLEQHALLSLLEHYHRGVFSLETIVAKTSHAVAKRFNIPNRGFIEEGFAADLVLIDMNNTTSVNKDDILYKCGWSPFEGYTFHSRIHSTIVNGVTLYQQGKLMEHAPMGQRLIFAR
jgi:dihydroorotase